MSWEDRAEAYYWVDFFRLTLICGFAMIIILIGSYWDHKTEQESGTACVSMQECWDAYKK